jgi:hypothetical protein
MFIEKYKVIQIISPKTTNEGIESRYVNLKNAVNAVVIVNLTQAAAHETQISIYQAKDTQGTDSKALISSVPVWANENTNADTLLKTDGAGYTVEETAGNKQIVFQIDPAKLDINEGFTCIGIKIGASSQAANFASADVIIDSRYSS